MKKKALKAMAVGMLTAVTMSMPVMAAPITLPDGTIFDPEFYAEANADVAANFGTSAEALYAHYDLFGRNEGRMPYGNMVGFDASYYAEKNPDVVTTVGTNPAALFQHYALIGYAEGRDVKVAPAKITETAEVMAFFKDVYTLMAAGNYQAVAAEYDGCDVAEAIVAEIPVGGHINFTADGLVSDYTGVAAGIYKMHDTGYYFYYGELQNGIRSGQGATVWELFTDSYETFVGTWADGAPNGEGKDTLYYPEEYFCTTQGNYTDGLENGEMTMLVYDDGYEYRMNNAQGGATYTAVMGTPQKLGKDTLSEELWEEVLYSSEKVAEKESEGKILYWYGVNDETNMAVWYWHDPSAGYLAALGYAW